MALVSSASIAGCYQVHERAVDAGPTDATQLDAPDVGPCGPPLPCTCGTFVGGGTCVAMGLGICCPIVGPLSPPDLASSTRSRA